jgi:biotin operon repressor
MGLVALEIDGARAEVDKALQWLKDKGVVVEPIEKNVIE